MSPVEPLLALFGGSVRIRPGRGILERGGVWRIASPDLQAR